MAHRLHTTTILKSKRREGIMADDHKPMNILSCFYEQPKPLDYCLPNMLAGTVGSLVSPGGAGKSMFALQLACQIAGGPDLLEIEDYPTGRVIFLPAEDPAIAMHHRLFAFANYLSEDDREIIADNLVIQPLLGLCPNIMDEKWFEGILRAAAGKRLMILDTLRRFHTEEENSSGPMAQVIGIGTSECPLTLKFPIYRNNNEKATNTWIGTAFKPI